MQTTTSWHWLALAVAIFFNVCANVSFKKAMRDEVAQSVFTAVLHLLWSGWFWTGVVCSLALVGSYLYALRAVPLFIAYPAVTGLAMAGIALASTAFLGSTLGLVQYFGLLLIVAGVVLLSI